MKAILSMFGVLFVLGGLMVGALGSQAADRCAAVGFVLLGVSLLIAVKYDDDSRLGRHYFWTTALSAIAWFGLAGFLGHWVGRINTDTIIWGIVTAATSVGALVVYRRRKTPG